jgi:hypothetical protein
MHLSATLSLAAHAPTPLPVRCALRRQANMPADTVNIIAMLEVELEEGWPVMRLSRISLVVHARFFAPNRLRCATCASVAI